MSTTDARLTIRHIFEDNLNWAGFRLAEKDNLHDVEITKVNKWAPKCPNCGRKMTFAWYEFIFIILLGLSLYTQNIECAYMCLLPTVNKKRETVEKKGEKWKKKKKKREKKNLGKHCRRETIHS